MFNVVNVLVVDLWLVKLIVEWFSVSVLRLELFVMF